MPLAEQDFFNYNKIAKEWGRKHKIAEQLVDADLLSLCPLYGYVGDKGTARSYPPGAPKKSFKNSENFEEVQE